MWVSDRGGVMTEGSGSTGAERHADQAGDPTGPEDAGSRKEEATPRVGVPV
jgi:hypothetical protein